MITKVQPLLEVIILAAGASKRLGKSKQLLKINDETMITRVAGIACKLSREFALTGPTVIVGKDQKAIEEELRQLPVSTLFNQDWAKGMGTSIAKGAVNLSDNCSAVLILTCDQVLLKCSDIKLLIMQWQITPKNIIVSSYGGIKGIPVIFPSRYFKELKHLDNDQGARVILKQHPDEIISVELPEAAHDLDTIEDEQLIRDKLGFKPGVDT